MNPARAKQIQQTVINFNKELEATDKELKEGYGEISASKAKLKSVIESYNYLLKGTDEAKLNEAIKDEIKVLKKYQKVQEEMIDNLNRKVTMNQYTAICSKMSNFRDDFAKTLGEDELLSLLVSIDEETEKLQKRKEVCKRKIDLKVNEKR